MACLIYITKARRLMQTANASS